MAERKFVLFQLGDEKYGLPIERVEQILPMQSVTPIPKTPELVLGLFDLRGKTVPVIDTRLRFGLGAVEDSQNFIIVSVEGGRFALQVDQVVGIATFADSAIDTEVRLIDGQEDRFVEAIGKQGADLTVLLNPDFIMPKEIAEHVAVAA